MTVEGVGMCYSPAVMFHAFKELKRKVQTHQTTDNTHVIGTGERSGTHILRWEKGRDSNNKTNHKPITMTAVEGVGMCYSLAVMFHAFQEVKKKA